MSVIRYIFLSLLFIPCGLAASAVSLLTASPGTEIYELEGHTGIRLDMRAEGGPDVVVHWGLYDFSAPNFVYRFVKGETDYMVGVTPTDRFIDSYTRTGRSVTEQVIALDSAQTATLVALIEENLKPGNQVYRYNYVKDNCATRPLAMLEGAVGHEFPMPELTAPTTFRHEMQHYHSSYPWYQFGIDLALGPGLDYPLTMRETAFAPMRLQELMAGQPEVTDTHVYGAATAQFVPTPWWRAPHFVCWMLFGLGTLLSVYDLLRRRVSRWFDAVWFTVCGLAGCLVAFLVFVSVHEASSPNWLLVWLNPLCFLAVVLPWFRSCRKALRVYHAANFTAVGLLMLLSPLTGQEFNAAFIPLMFLTMERSVLNAARP